MANIKTVSTKEMSTKEAQAIVTEINIRLMQGKNLGTLAYQLMRDNWDLEEIDSDEATAGYQVKLVEDATYEVDEEEDEESEED